MCSSMVLSRNPVCGCALHVRVGPTGIGGEVYILWVWPSSDGRYDNESLASAVLREDLPVGLLAVRTIYEG